VKGRKRPPPTQVLRPSPVEDADRISGSKVSATNELRPSRVLDPEIFDRFRQDANYLRWLTNQLPDNVWTKIAELLGRYPLASNNQIADWVRADPETGPLVAHIKRRTLAGKIGKLRK
jgi:hypothetical protein